MTYRELLELYKKKQLEEDKRKQIEIDIERQEAISEYLFERDGIEVEETGIIEGEESREEDFVKVVKGSIRKAFLKMGAVVLAISILVIIFVIFILPNLVSRLYYDPGKEIGDGINQMSLDMAVYTELCIPGYSRDNVEVSDKGYGNYDITIMQNYSYTDSFNNVTGKIERGKMTLFNPNIIVKPTGNAFAWFQTDLSLGDSLTEIIKKEEANLRLDESGEEIHASHGIYGNKAEAEESLKRLNSMDKYVGYVTLNKMMPYSDFMCFADEKITGNGLWCGVKTSGEEEEQNFRTYNLGFYCSLNSTSNLSWDEKKYPELKVWTEKNWDDKNVENNLRNEKYMKTHFTSLLRYMADQTKFPLNEEGDISKYKSAADYVEKNGLNVYGFAVIGTKEELIKINNLSQVYGVYATELK